jgi:hypothetical protein
VGLTDFGLRRSTGGMFTTSTVFVLGAGVSAPFGFPTGDRLLQILTGNDLEVGPSADAIRVQHGHVLRMLRYSHELPDEIDKFVFELRRSGTPSIDNWLARRPEFQTLGKTAIALVIASAENKVLSHGYVEDDWYKWLFDKLTRGVMKAENLKANKVSFITFNYDRMLEWRLRENILGHYGQSSESEKAVAELLSRIFHVHGVIGENDKDLLSDFGSIRVPAESWFSSDQEQEFIAHGRHALKLSSSIRIIDELAARDPHLDFEITSRIDGGEKIIFLGFGYDERNMSLLRMGSRVARINIQQINESPHCPIVGSGYLLGRAQIHDAKAEFAGKIYLGDPGSRSVKFCNDHVSIKSTPTIAAAFRSGVREG